MPHSRIDDPGGYSAAAIILLMVLSTNFAIKLCQSAQRSLWKNFHKRISQSLKTDKMDNASLLKIYQFLEKTAETNEATTFDASQELMLEQLMALVKAKGKTSIAEDFATPYVHPMITVQKWVEELKLIVRDALLETSAAE
jgi:GTPase Era involved in 16S rRNA processing